MGLYHTKKEVYTHFQVNDDNTIQVRLRDGESLEEILEYFNCAPYVAISKKRPKHRDYQPVINLINNPNNQITYEYPINFKESIFYQIFGKILGVKTYRFTRIYRD